MAFFLSLPGFSIHRHLIGIVAAAVSVGSLRLTLYGSIFPFGLGGQTKLLTAVGIQAFQKSLDLFARYVAFVAIRPHRVCPHRVFGVKLIGTIPPVVIHEGVP